jgi:hypothetical protein
VTRAPTVAVPPNMASDLNTKGTTTLDLPQDPNVLNSAGSPTQEVYVIIAFTGKLP